MIDGCPVWPADDATAERLLRVFVIQKLFYEVTYEAANRPNWLTIPLRGISGLFDGTEPAGASRLTCRPCGRCGVG